MNYLFFDIECSNSFDGRGKICEFGYVLTDEKLATVDHGIFLINPDSEFEQYVIWKIIKYKVEEYLKAPKYPEVYNNHIRRLLELPNTVLVGHGVSNDVKFLYDESLRYSLPAPAFNVIDASLIWQRYHNDKQRRNLKKLVNELGIGNPKIMHNSEYDALMTVEYVKVMYAERCDIFCHYDKFDENGKKMPEKKLGFIKSAISNGKSIVQIPLDELFDILGITKESLEQMPEQDVEKLLANV